MVGWCIINKLISNMDKTKDTVYFQPSHAPNLINETVVEVVSGTMFLGVHIMVDLTWSLNTVSLVKRAQQCAHLLHRMRKAHLSLAIRTTFQSSTIESILINCISVWSGGCRVADWKIVRWVVRTPETHLELPSLYSGYCM